MPRLVVALVIAVALAACTDVRDYTDFWVGDGSMQLGGPADTSAVLRIEHVDKHSFAGRLTIDGLVAEGTTLSVPTGIEADVLSSITFDGAPLRVYLAFVRIMDDRGDALVVISLHDERVEVRVIRSGLFPIYAVFALHRA